MEVLQSPSLFPVNVVSKKAEWKVRPLIIPNKYEVTLTLSAGMVSEEG